MSKTKIGFIIFLNGSSSVGKSSLAQEIMKQSSLPLLYFSIDHLVNYYIDEKFVSLNTETYQKWQKEWFFHVEEKDKRGNSLVKIQDGSRAKKLHKDIIKCWGYLAHQDHSLIIDEVIWRKEIFTFYQQEFSHIKQSIYLVKVKCDLEVAIRREKDRGDRFVGLARGLKEVEKIIPSYDLEIDTTATSPTKNAEIILNFIKKYPAPITFKKNKIIKIS